MEVLNIARRAINTIKRNYLFKVALATTTRMNAKGTSNVQLVRSRSGGGDKIGMHFFVPLKQVNFIFINN
jgi:hypothetical protein